MNSLVILSSCGGSGSDTGNALIDPDNSTDVTIIDADFEATDWTDATQSKEVDPNFEAMFDETQVKRPTSL